MIKNLTPQDVSGTGLGPENGPALKTLNSMIGEHNELYSGLEAGVKKVYVSPSGSDLSGAGSLARPYLTIDRAMKDIPTVIPDGSYYAVMLANGTYKSLPNFHKLFGGIGNLVFDSYEHPVAIAATEYEVSAASSVGYVKGLITITTSPFTADEHYGKLIRMTSGDYAGYTTPIFKNGTNTITTTSTIAGLISAGDTFEIVKPGVTIEVDNDVMIAANGGHRSSVVFYNIEFKKSASFSGSYIAQFSGTVDFSFFSCVGVNNDDGAAYYRLENEVLNNMSYNSKLGSNFSLYKTISTFPYGDIKTLSYISCLFGIQSYTAPSELEDHIHIYYVTGGVIARIVARGVVQAGECKMSFGNALISKLFFSELVDAVTFSLAMDAPDGCDCFFEINKGSNMMTSFGHVDGTATSAVVEMLQSRWNNASSLNFTAATAPYFAKLGFDSKMYLGGVPASTNSTEDVYFVRSDAAAAFPASGASINDTEASFAAVE